SGGRCRDQIAPRASYSLSAEPGAYGHVAGCGQKSGARNLGPLDPRYRSGRNFRRPDQQQRRRPPTPPRRRPAGRLARKSEDRANTVNRMQQGLVALALGMLGMLAACAPRLEPAGPAVQHPALLEDRLVQADRAALPMRRWLPEGAPRAVIVALHGFNDYSYAFEKPGTYWATRGIATYAFDQRGFGGAPNRGLWAGHDTMVADAAAAVALIRARYPDRPLYVAGESMGGAIAMIAAARGLLEADGLILVAPALRGRRYIGALPRATL
ncbi:unnamed protein product, partial [Laminaria digitata]